MITRNQNKTEIKQQKLSKYFFIIFFFIIPNF